MYYIYLSPTNNNFIHVTRDTELYSEAYLISRAENKDFVRNIAVDLKKEICWCDEQPIPQSLS